MSFITSKLYIEVCIWSCKIVYANIFQFLILFCRDISKTYDLV